MFALPQTAISTKSLESLKHWNVKYAIKVEKLIYSSILKLGTENVIPLSPFTVWLNSAKHKDTLKCSVLLLYNCLSNSCS